MRIIAGQFKGHALASPKGDATRPTGDRLRESIFNILAHGDFPLRGARVLDLFAGTGAMGIEALSRGAVYCLFVEDAPAPRAAIRRNIESLGLTGITRIFRRDATALGLCPAGKGGAFDLVFIDPPYRKDLVRPALAGLLAGGWLAPSALLVIETAAEEMLDLPSGLAGMDRRRYGDTQILLARAVER